MSGTEVVSWRRSQRCEANTCVEVAHVGERVMLRDSTDPAGPILAFSADAWRSFADGVQAGEFDGAL